MLTVDRLEKNISDTSMEGFLKIGYIEQQPIRIYYDEGLLRELLGLVPPADINSALEEFVKCVKVRLGEVRFTKTKGRYECFVSAEGAKYINEHNSRRDFLHELITSMGKRDLSIEDVLKIFRRESEDIIILETEGEFQYVVSFADKKIDEFLYCFTFNEMGSYYHRLLQYDFDRL